MSTRRQDKAQAKKEAILLAALDIFSAKGVAAARVEDIAKAAHVGKGTIYLYFQAKEDIFTALLQHILEPVHEASVAIMREEGGTLREKLWRMAQPFLVNNGLSPVSQAIRLTQAEGLHNPHLVRFYQDRILETAGHVREAMCKGGLPEEVCQHSQLLMAPLLHGIVWQGLMGNRQAVNLAEMYRVFLERILPEGKE